MNQVVARSFERSLFLPIDKTYNSFVYGKIKKGFYLRGTIDKAEKHEEFVVLAEGWGDDGKRVDDRDSDEYTLAAQGVCHGAPRVRAHHHADEDYTVQPSLKENTS